MNLKKLPNWLKGGLIGLSIPLAALILSKIPIISIVSIPLVIIVNFTLSIFKDPNLTLFIQGTSFFPFPTIKGFLLSTIPLTILGAIIGLLIKKK